ncbi:MAG TPA: GTPase ObgE [Candidatus Dormibacteraeota bacterium]|nr:GTPase ObgE [Candidatus Dormibacteraeota bacterium]
MDSARITVRGGHGGKGSASFRREPFVPRGGPDGGDGGRGGSVILKASNEVTDLSQFRRKARWHAEAGGDGAGGRKTGRNGKDLTVEVPVGTIALDSDGALVADLDRPGATSVVAEGGVGGRGNVHFKSSTRRAPDYAEPGLGGDERNLTLDLKLIADVGLVGPPNAGKSSLLRALTAARPKVGDYPFTTLDPELGVADVTGTRFVIADIPGLIEGAAQGAGLGQRFLRHVERTKALVYVLDGSAPDPWKDLETVRKEVAQFSSALAERPDIVAVNKVDLEAARKLRARTRRAGVFFISAHTGEGIPALAQAIATLVTSAPAPQLPVAARVTKLRPRGASALSVEKKGSAFIVHGDHVERLLERFDLDSEGGLARFQSELDRLGVNRALESAGVQPGDTVRIAMAEFEYQP